MAQVPNCDEHTHFSLTDHLKLSIFFQIKNIILLLSPHLSNIIDFFYVDMICAQA